MGNQIIQVSDLNQNEYYEIKKKTLNKKPRFTMLGNKMQSLDIIADFNKPEAFAFKLLKNQREYEDNISLFDTGSLSSTDKVVFYKGYKSLEQKNLIKRIKKGRPSKYIFNPNFIIPNDYDESLNIWNKISS